MKILLKEFKDSLCDFGCMNEQDTFQACIKSSIFIDSIEDTLDYLAKKNGIRVKPMRIWLVNTCLQILKTIHLVHLEHTMLPVQHMEKKRRESVPSPSLTTLQTSLRIQIPKGAVDDLILY
jgi:hypothetical protein